MRGGVFATAPDSGEYIGAPMPSSLYIVSTPVGNLEDITFRAVRVLKEVEAVACEDTRVTRKLLSRYSIRTRLMSCHEHNEARQAGEIVRILKGGGDVALVTDAGTPLLSDPGRRVVERVLRENFPVVPVPGASALLSALAVCAVPFSEFTFLGFLPKTQGRAVKTLSEFVSSPRPLVIYESPVRVIKLLRLVLDVLGDRDAAVCREMTKMYEEVIRAPVSSIIDTLEKREKIKGEIVVVVSGAEEGKGGVDEGAIENRLLELKGEGVSFKDALKTVADEFGAGKNSIYDFARRVWDL